MDSNMVGATGLETEMSQIKVTFTTTEDDIQLPETRRQLLVPAGTPARLVVPAEMAMMASQIYY